MCIANTMNLKKAKMIYILERRKYLFRQDILCTMNELGLYALPKLLLRYLKKKISSEQCMGAKQEERLFLDLIWQEKMMTYSSSHNATL